MLNWAVFTYSMSAQARSSPRVALWRRLRRIGAVSPANGVFVLPARDECVEAFQWLAQEIRAAKGEALVMRVEQFEGIGYRIGNARDRIVRRTIQAFRAK